MLSLFVNKSDIVGGNSLSKFLWTSIKSVWMFLLCIDTLLLKESNSLKGISFISEVKLKALSWILLIKFLTSVNKASVKVDSNWIDPWWKIQNKYSFEKD